MTVALITFGVVAQVLCVASATDVGVQMEKKKKDGVVLGLMLFCAFAAPVLFYLAGKQ